MEEIVLEVGMKLSNSLVYYHDILIKNGLKLDFACITHDLYYTKQNLEGLTENQMKKACIRVRYCNAFNKEEDNSKLVEQEQKLLNDGYKKVFDTLKMDFQYCKKDMKSKVQLQDIKDIGLLVYYDNPDYYKYSEDEQRKLLLDELNSYGFEFNGKELGLDKLRTLYYRKKMYSKNQNS